MQKLFELRTERAKLGYEIVGTRLNWVPYIPKEKPIPISELRPIEPALTVRGGSAYGRKYESVDVELEDGLFLRFAQLERDPEAVLNFANEYGSLLYIGLPLAVALTSVQDDCVESVLFNKEDELPFSAEHGPLAGYYAGVVETLSYWYGVMERMRQALEAWEEAKRGSQGASDDLHEQIGENLGDALPLRIRYGAGNSLELVISPGTLEKALWLQLALAVDGRKDFRKCANPACGNWFEIGKWGSRTDRIHCSNACKQARQDAKKREAKKAEESRP